ncbi:MULTISPECIES: hypothetical protein [unclassified Pseudomonas]|uniref:hypothetical protein n=1 Tax=unclassified Pseudomonas TaxID=196821 RepID=UPI001CBBFE0E|nr:MULTISPECIES: hypothetical protein [unclassified Pseudomonas]
MSEEATAAMTNLELCRELYTEDQRRKFYADYQAARCANEAAFEAYCELDDPRGWKFWQRPPTDWNAKQEKLMEAYQQARRAVITLEHAHPLLVKVYLHKGHPI